MVLQINSNKINHLLSLLFPGAFARVDKRVGCPSVSWFCGNIVVYQNLWQGDEAADISSGQGEATLYFLTISTHYSNTARIFNRRVHQAQGFQTAYFFLIFRQSDKAAVFHVNAYLRHFIAGLLRSAEVVRSVGKIWYTACSSYNG